MSIMIPSNARKGAGLDRSVARATGAKATNTASDEAVAAVPAVVYLAAAQNTYGTMLYRLAMRRLAETWPGAVLMDADACGFSSRADWQLRWPFIREGIDGLVVLSEGDGTISHDTWLELRDATDLGLPCWLVTADGALAPVTVVSFRLYPMGARSSRRWARAELPSDA
ncbi:MAG: hypothetical protein ABSG81_04580 [Acidimicrobiales bacterium]|jgi:hypothetical protein